MNLKKTEDNTLSVKLKRNLLGQIVKKVETLNKQRKNIYHYTYDQRGRLTQVKERKNIVESYTYDSNGNRQSATVHNQTITASYTLDDNLIVYGQNTYSYDDDGYLTEKTTPQGTTTYSYGTLGELKQVNTPTQTITYKHNANNQRVVKLADGVIVEKYLWANLTTLLAIYDKDDNLVQRFEYADNRMPLSMTDVNGTKYYLHYDQVGSLRAVSRVLSPDNTFEVVKEITYDTYGNILTDSNTSFKVPFGFAGGLYDSDTKLTRFGYRDYDAYTGKWTAKDPIGFSGGDSNLYGYVLGDPVDFVDPVGENAATIVVGGAILIGGYIATRPNNIGNSISNWWNEPHWWEMASRGNVADTAITQSLQREGTNGKNRCDWLKDNAHRWSKKQVKATEKAWGCRHSRESKDKCRK